MHTQIYVNLPVKNLPRTQDFAQLGFTFMVGHGFEDLDGHLWELVCMDPNAAPPHA